MTNKAEVAKAIADYAAKLSAAAPPLDQAQRDALSGLLAQDRREQKQQPRRTRQQERRSA